jgi:hypothetical protein
VPAPAAEPRKKMKRSLVFMAVSEEILKNSHDGGLNDCKLPQAAIDL